MGSVALEMQKRIKQAWDPKNILNPGKIFLPPTGSGPCVGNE
jgi:glycolate oxidase